MFFIKFFSNPKSFSLSTILIFTILFSFIPLIYAQFDFDSFLGSSISDTQIDGIIGTEWDDAGNYPEISIGPSGIAEIWTKNDGTYLYIAIEFTADSSNPWVGIQFERTSHMSSGADGAIFGNDRIGPNEYRDISFGGFGQIASDTTQDGVGAINIGDSNLVTIEIKKPLSSGDSSGSDIDWNVDESYTLIIIWDSNGGGSSGGSSSHTGSSQINRTIFINPNVIPEFSTILLVPLFITATLLAIFYRRKRTQK